MASRPNETAADSQADSDFIPLCIPDLSGREREYVNSCFETNWVSSAGPFVDRFEEAFAEKVGAKHAVSCVNGTAALHIGIQLAGVQPGDEVLVNSLTFIASANAIRYAGAEPFLVDAEPRHWQMDFSLVRRFLESGCQWKQGRWWNKQTQRPIGAILTVHVLGHPADLEELDAIRSKYSLPVIEDAAEALGSTYRGVPIGGHGNLACFSFNGNKIMTCGGGGMLVTDSEQLAERAKYLTTQAKDDPIEYIHNEVGYNYRLPNMLAAMGYGQLECLDQKLAKKRQIAARYQQAFDEIAGLTCFASAEETLHNHWLSAIVVDPDLCRCDSRQLLQFLADRNIQSRPLWQPLHLSPAYAGSGTLNGAVAEQLYARTLCLPCSTSLTAAQQARVIEAVKACISHFGQATSAA